MGVNRHGVQRVRRWNLFAHPAATSSFAGFCAEPLGFFHNDQSGNNQLRHSSIGTVYQWLLGTAAGVTVTCGPQRLTIDDPTAKQSPSMPPLS
jgi:hypothetical protein